ncbi:PKD domain-containing protein [Candidatus Bipolaricaulota bacterium]|nr:PKD domain-containing protein [Candidatus Bipolaricaulota bacterium]
MERGSKVAELLTSLLVCVLLVLTFGLRIRAGGEPDFEVESDFGSIGINGHVYDASTGEEIAREKVSFWVLPNSADSPGEIERIKVEAPGYVPSYVSNFSKRGIDLGFKQLVVFELGRIALPPANGERIPKITIESSPSGGAIYIDGEYEGRTPVHRLELESGSHGIRISKQGYEDWEREVYLSSGEYKKVSASEADLNRKNKPPEADFVYSPYKPSVGETVQFASRAQDPDGKIVSYRWEFGDGSKDWGEKATNKYGRRGKYSVTLLVTDDKGDTDSKRKDVEVQQENQSPSVDFTYSPSTINPGDIVGFESQASDPDGYVSSWNWEFGDGSSSANRNPEHQYEKSGAFTVTLMVKDQAGASESESKEVVVKSSEPEASFTVRPENPRAGERVELDATGSSHPDGRIVSYGWDLDGDGSVEREVGDPKAYYQFEESGRHLVSLTVTGHEGTSSSAEKELNVSEIQLGDVEIDEKHALVVGISEYKYEDRYPKLELNYAARDARAFRDFLVDESKGGFPEDNVTLLTNEDATRDRFDESLRNLVTSTDEDDLVVIYYSGHGAPGPDYDEDEDGQDEYYITYDTNPKSKETIFNTGYRDDDFADRVGSLSSNQVAVFLDSCYSGGATKSIKGFSVKDMDTPSPGSVFQDFNFGESDGSVLFAASKEDQTSYEGEGEDIEHGLFTHFLLKGLNGEADENNDGRITVDELKNYIVPQVENYVEEHDLPERTLGGTPQTPLVKGRITAPLVKGRENLEGTVEHIIEGDRAREGGRVMVDLGSEDGVEVGDGFRVYSSPKGVEVLNEKGASLEIEEVIASHLSLCKVVNADQKIKEGVKIERVETD